MLPSVKGTQIVSSEKIVKQNKNQLTHTFHSAVTTKLTKLATSFIGKYAIGFLFKQSKLWNTTWPKLSPDAVKNWHEVYNVRSWIPQIKTGLENVSKCCNWCCQFDSILFTFHCSRSSRFISDDYGLFVLSLPCYCGLRVTSYNTNWTLLPLLE